MILQLLKCQSVRDEKQHESSTFEALKAFGNCETNTMGKDYLKKDKKQVITAVFLTGCPPLHSLPRFQHQDTGGHGEEQEAHGRAAASPNSAGIGVVEGRVQFPHTQGPSGLGYSGRGRVRALQAEGPELRETRLWER